MPEPTKGRSAIWRARIAVLAMGVLLAFGACDAHGRALGALATAGPQSGGQPGTQAETPAPNPQEIFEEARKAQKNGNSALAVKKYQQLIKLHPEVVAAHANLAVVLVSLGRFDEAITQYHIALAEAPQSLPLRLDLGLAYYKKGDFAGAAAQFASLHEAQPDSVRVTTLLANCQVQLGLVTQAIALLKPLEKANADNLDLEWALGTALIRDGQTLEGLKRVQKVAEQGHSAEAYQLAADLYLGLTYFDTARRDAEAVIRLNPKMSKAYVVLGMVQDYAGNMAAGAKEYEKALQVDPNDLQARLRLANDFYSERKLEEARIQINHVLAAAPHSVGALYELALIERSEGNLQAALKNLQTVVRQDPKWLLPHIELVALYYRVNRPADGARERKIVDQLRAEVRKRRDKTHMITPQVPPQ